jgi:hypothetical protein
MGSFTAEAWIKTANAGANQRTIVAHQQFGGPGWYLVLNNNVLGFASTVDSLALTTKGVALNDNKWHHVAVVRDITSLQKAIKWYVDGKLVGSQNTLSSASYAVNGALDVGSLWAGVLWQFSGLIDEVSVINRTLTTQEIYEEYAAGSVCRKFDNKFTQTVTFKDACRESEAAPSGAFNISTESTINGTCPGGVGRVADSLTKLVTFNIVGGGANVSADTYLTKMFLCTYL